MSCHETKYTWYGVKMQTRPSGHHTGQDCKGCHTYNGGFRGLMRPIMRGALVNPELGRLLPNLQIAQPSRGTLGTNFDHQGVKPGKCKTCHDGQRASGIPARHLMVNASCDI